MKKFLTLFLFFSLTLLFLDQLLASNLEDLPKTNDETPGVPIWLGKYWVEITTLLACFIIGLIVRFLTEKIDSSFDEGIFYGLANMFAFAFIGFIVFLVNYRNSGFWEYFPIGFTALGAYALGWGPGATIISLILNRKNKTEKD